MRAGYERRGERAFDVEAYIPVGSGYVIIDHPGVDLLRSGNAVTFGVKGLVPIGPLQMNVPALGKLVGIVNHHDLIVPSEEDDLVFSAKLVPE